VRLNETVIRQGIGDGIAFCHPGQVPNNSDVVSTAFCPNGATLVKGSQTFEDLLNEPISESLSFIFNPPSGMSAVDYQVMITSSNQQVLSDEDLQLVVRIEEGSVTNFTALVAIPSFVGVTDLIVTATPMTGGTTFQFVLRYVVKGLAVTATSLGTLSTGNLINFDSWRTTFDQPIVLLSIVLEGVDLIDAKIRYVDSDYAQQVYHDNSCPSVVAKISSGGAALFNQGVGMKNSSCGFGFSEDGKFLVAQFLPYRTGDGRLTFTLRWNSVSVNGEVVPYVAMVDFSWTGLGPPVVSSVNIPTQPLDHNGGQQISLTGFNLIPSANESIVVLSLESEGSSFQLPELLSSRETVDLFNSRVFFLTIPSRGLSLLNISAISVNNELENLINEDPNFNQNLMFNDLSPLGSGLVRVSVLFGILDATLVDVLLLQDTFRCGLSSLIEVNCNFSDSLSGQEGAFSYDPSLSTIRSVLRIDAIGGLLNVSFQVPENLQSRVFGNFSSALATVNANDTLRSDLFGGFSVIVLQAIFPAIGERAVRTTKDALIGAVVFIAIGLALAGILLQLLISTSSNLSGPLVLCHEDSSDQDELPALERENLACERQSRGRDLLMERANQLQARMGQSPVEDEMRLFRKPHGNLNPMSVISPVQRLAMFGQVGASGLGSPFVDVAAGVSFFNLQIPGISFSGGVSKSVRSLEDFYNAYQADIVGLVEGQLFWIAIVTVILLVLHVCLYFFLYRHRRIQRITLDVVHKFELLFFHLIFLGIILGVFQLYSQSDRPAQHIILGSVALVIFGIGYPAFVIFVLLSRVRPHLSPWNEIRRRRALVSGWKSSEHLQDYMDYIASLADVGMEEVLSRICWWRPLDSKRFAGAWIHDAPVRKRYGVLFECYKGRFFAFFAVELAFIAINASIVGGLTSFPGAQAGLLLTVAIFEFLVLLWLVPYNDVVESCSKLFVTFLNIISTGLVVRAATLTPGSAASIQLSKALLYVNIVAICTASIYCIFSMGEMLIRLRSRIIPLAVALFRPHEDDRFSDYSMDGRSDSSTDSSNSDFSRRVRMMDATVLYGSMLSVPSERLISFGSEYSGSGIDVDHDRLLHKKVRIKES